MKSDPGNRPLRIALLSSGLGYTLRGVETWMMDLESHLPDDVHVELWSGGPLQPHRRTGRRCFSLDRESRWLRPLSWHRRYHIEQLSQLPSVIAATRRHRPDILYCGDPALTFQLKRFQGLHQARVVFMNGMRLAANWIARFDGVHLLAGAYLEEARRSMPGADLSHFFAIPHFTDTSRFTPAAPDVRLQLRTRFGLPTEALVILSIGPIGTASRKRLDHLAREVASAHPSAVLLHAGSDEEGAEPVRTAVNQALGGRIRWLGRVERSTVRELMAAADAYSLGSLGEPFSIAILEALSCGLPVVHHKDPVMTWQTGPGGIPVSMETPGDAAAAFARLAADPGFRSQLAAGARALALERYSPGSVCRSLVTELQRIARRPFHQT